MFVIEDDGSYNLSTASERLYTEDDYYVRVFPASDIIYYAVDSSNFLAVGISSQDASPIVGSFYVDTSYGISLVNNYILGVNYALSYFTTIVQLGSEYVAMGYASRREYSAFIEEFRYAAFSYSAYSPPQPDAGFIPFFVCIV
jgi:hypothetical protein